MAFSIFRGFAGYTIIRIFAVIGILLTLETLLKTTLFRKPQPVALESSRIAIAVNEGYGDADEDGSTSLHPEIQEDEAVVKSTVKDKTGETKAVIAPSLKEDDLTWIYELLPDFEKYIYVVNDPFANLTVVQNVGREASVYLTFIINHYYSLPDYMVFIHGKRYQWHSDDPMYDTYPQLRDLRTDYVKEQGYTNLRCAWKPGCPATIFPDASIDDGLRDDKMEGMYARTFPKLFPSLEEPKEVGVPCCAQFAVTKEQVRKRPVTDYERFRQWIWDDTENSFRKGMFMEYSWHILFGKPTVACTETAEDCYCKKYGRCNLECPNERECKGRWWLPPGFDLGLFYFPKDWPKGMGEKGYPPNGWWREFAPHNEEDWAERYKDLDTPLHDEDV